MQYCDLSKSGLRVSRIGLGCGGPSRLGRVDGRVESDVVDLIETALSLGINLIDTAAVYGNEPVVGSAIRAHRGSVVLSTKILLPRHPTRLSTGSLAGRTWRQVTDRLELYLTEAALRTHVGASLRRLKTDYVDILWLHAVTPRQYGHAAALLPALEQLKAEGVVRAVGVSEAHRTDTAHQMLREAASEPRWDVLMVRLTDPIVDTLRNTLLTAVANGTGLIAMGNPLPPGSDRWAGGYRTALETSGIVSVLAGTGNKQHLMENVAALGRPGGR